MGAAARGGLGVAAHAHGDAGARDAVLAGVVCIEHGTYLSRETLGLMKDSGTVQDILLVVNEGKFVVRRGDWPTAGR